MGDDLAKLKVTELKDRLKDLRLSTSGKKADLLARLREAIDAPVELAEPPAPAPMEEEEAEAPPPAPAPPAPAPDPPAPAPAMTAPPGIPAPAVDTAAADALALAKAKASALASAALAEAEQAAAEEAEAEDAGEAMEVEEPAASKSKSKGKKKKKKKKKKKAQHTKAEPSAAGSALVVPTKGDEIEYVADEVEDSLPSTDEFEDFKRIFSTFAKPEELFGTAAKAPEEAATEKATDDAKTDEAKDDAAESELSKKKKKLETRMSIAQLKHLVKRPELIEVWDVTAQDPRLLAHLKAYRNTVPVPRHWSQKRKYLQGKRGIEKAPFQLPDFIENTGIAKIREAYQEKEAEKKSKQKQRDRTMGKTNKIDIDYQILHDAFFRFQTKPDLSRPGELYYEGKEFEVQIHDKRPGMLSDALKAALGMPDGSPPPWLINMQRYGPPPSYPYLKVQGLNAPIPEGAQFGYHPGGWGKPPVDEFGRPLYGDVFGTAAPERDMRAEPIEKNPWGDLEEEEDDESSEEEENERDEMDDDESQSGISSVTSITSMSSLSSGLETPDAIDLRKDSGGPKQLYQVIEQKDAHVGGGLMGSSHRYVMPTEGAAAAKPGKSGTGMDLINKNTDTNVALDAADMESEEAMQAALQRKFEEAQKEKAAANQKEDFSDMVAQESSKMAKKRKASADKKGKDKKFKNVF